MKVQNETTYKIEMTFKSLKELEAFYNAREVIGMGCFDLNELPSSLLIKNNGGSSKEAIQRALLQAITIDTDKQLVKLLRGIKE